MGTNCHIMIEQPMALDDSTGEAHPRSVCIMAAADVRWSSHDEAIREAIGVPSTWSDSFWEHKGTTEEYERIFLAAQAHKDALWKQREETVEYLHTLEFGDSESIQVERQEDRIAADIERTEEWLAYYELAFVLSQLGHKVICYGC